MGMPRRYNGYTSCPLVTGRNKLILAEFDYYGNPMETFPVNRAEERSSMYMLKRDAMPAMYWSALLKGLWDGQGRSGECGEPTKWCRRGKLGGRRAVSFLAT